MHYTTQNNTESWEVSEEMVKTNEEFKTKSQYSEGMGIHIIILHQRPQNNLSQYSKTTKRPKSYNTLVIKSAIS